MKICCEEMREFVKSLGRKPNISLGETYLIEPDDGEPDEVAFGTPIAMPNIVFRFCPYCGASQTEVENTGVSFLDELKARLFSKSLEEKTSLSCRVVLLEETLESLQKLFKDEAPKLAKKIQQ